MAISLISLIYASLAIGSMLILSPLTAIIGAIVPAAVGIIDGKHFAVTGYIGIGLVLLAVVLVGFVPEKGAVRPSLRGLSMAAGSALMGVTWLILGLVTRRRRLRSMLVDASVRPRTGVGLGNLCFAILLAAKSAQATHRTRSDPGRRPGLGRRRPAGHGLGTPGRRFFATPPAVPPNPPFPESVSP